MMRLDLLPKIRGDFFNFSEQIFSAIQVAKTSSELVHEEERFNFRLFRYNYGGGTGKENQKKINTINQDRQKYLTRSIKMNEEDFKNLRTVYDSQIAYLDFKLHSLLKFFKKNNISINNF